jgi:hypothetical protein
LGKILRQDKMNDRLKKLLGLDTRQTIAQRLNDPATLAGAGLLGVGFLTRKPAYHMLKSHMAGVRHSFNADKINRISKVIERIKARTSSPERIARYTGPLITRLKKLNGTVQEQQADAIAHYIQAAPALNDVPILGAAVRGIARRARANGVANKNWDKVFTTDHFLNFMQSPEYALKHWHHEVRSGMRYKAYQKYLAALKKEPRRMLNGRITQRRPRLERPKPIDSLSDEFLSAYDNKLNRRLNTMDTAHEQIFGGGIGQPNLIYQGMASGKTFPQTITALGKDKRMKNYLQLLYSDKRPSMYSHARNEAIFSPLAGLAGIGTAGVGMYE